MKNALSDRFRRRQKNTVFRNDFGCNTSAETVLQDAKGWHSERLKNYIAEFHEKMIFLLRTAPGTALFFSVLVLTLVFPGAEMRADGRNGLNWETEWGGHARIQGRLWRPDDETVWRMAGTGTYLDGTGELRLKNRLSVGEKTVLETHYEIMMTGGDSRRQGTALAEALGMHSVNTGLLTGGGPPEDDRRLMDLTRIIDTSDDYFIHHRIDRLVISRRFSKGSVRIGRQALTWGNGLLFHPLDLFNPFSPTDVLRDYKIGDDMALVQFFTDDISDAQVLLVPRRSTESGDVEADSSALAAKVHFSGNALEIDLMAGWNHENIVAGVGSTGYLGNAAWRADAAYTFLPSESGRNGYFSAVVNIDYSWGWMGKNAYGFIEGHYNGLGNDDYENALTDADVTDALTFGEVFTLGRLYLAGSLQLEIHPLFNVFLTAVTNLEDPSGALQPRCAWSAAENFEILAGGNLYWGGSGTEYGGYVPAGTGFSVKPANSAYIWMTYFF